MQNRFRTLLLVSLVVAGGALFSGGVVTAGQADVIAATATRSADGTYQFTATLAHADSGWDHYANMWEVIGPDGAVLAERELLHPHVNEQPFTRGLSGVKIPDDVHNVIIRARDIVHGWGGAEVKLQLPMETGQ
ncbi:hypothetical protein [Thalassospira sp. CH_XMU1448-2]|uniref:hypothetical protein n=1 Tax=Thalassospira sp. CH_XMU1448-2 TaxID=3107773 RepID=UPI0030082FB8